MAIVDTQGRKIDSLSWKFEGKDEHERKDNVRKLTGVIREWRNEDDDWEREFRAWRERRSGKAKLKDAELEEIKIEFPKKDGEGFQKD